MRRKRNMQAKVLKTDRQFQQKVVPSKKRRDKFSIEDALNEVAEDSEDRTDRVQGQDSKGP